jgi:hypothetical protein
MIFDFVLMYAMRWLGGENVFFVTSTYLSASMAKCRARTVIDGRKNHPLLPAMLEGQ